MFQLSTKRLSWNEHVAVPIRKCLIFVPSTPPLLHRINTENRAKANQLREVNSLSSHSFIKLTADTLATITKFLCNQRTTDASKVFPRYIHFTGLFVNSSREEKESIMIYYTFRNLFILSWKLSLCLLLNGIPSKEEQCWCSTAF